MDDFNSLPGGFAPGLDQIKRTATLAAIGVVINGNQETALLLQTISLPGLDPFIIIFRMKKRYWIPAAILSAILLKVFFMDRLHSVHLADSKPSPHPTVLVVDMPVDHLILRETLPDLQIEIAPQSRAVLPMDQKTCASDLELLEKSDQRTATSLSPSDITRIKKIAIQTHGYHILGLVSRLPQSGKLIHLGLSPAPENGIRDVESYIQSAITEDMTRLREALKQYQPALVQLASSDTFEENEQDLILGGHASPDARRDARRIMAAWKQEWERILHDFPDTIFVVAAGNGGIDGIGDQIIPGNPDSPLPASIPAKNMIRVSASSKDGCLAGFSNTGSDVATDGVEILSATGCKDKSTAHFSGTSQASALFTRYLATGFDAGASLQELVSKLKKTPCIRDKVRFGGIPR